MRGRLYNNEVLSEEVKKCIFQDSLLSATSYRLSTISYRL